MTSLSLSLSLFLSFSVAFNVDFVGNSNVPRHEITTDFESLRVMDGLSLHFPRLIKMVIDTATF